MSTNNTSLHDTELALLVDRFMRRIHFGLQSRAPDFDKKSVGPGGGFILMTLADMGYTRLNELTRRVARDKSQMTRTMHSLERKGLVRREPSPTDGRVSMVSLTPEGDVVVGELMAAVADAIGEILEPISEEEKETLKHLLRRIHV
ncbi:MAG: MarR family winged helix-turn-helix transcriptional regulator [Pseudomonadota bacterium]